MRMETTQFTIGKDDAAKRIYELGSIMIRIDGDRDHTNKSDLSAEQSADIGKELVLIATRILGFDEAAYWNNLAGTSATSTQ